MKDQRYSDSSNDGILAALNDLSERTATLDALNDLSERMDKRFDAVDKDLGLVKELLVNQGRQMVIMSEQFVNIDRRFLNLEEAA